MFDKLFGSKKSEVTLKVEGMHCEGCSNTLSGVLRNTKGVVSNEVSLPDHSAKVVFDPTKVTAEEIIHNVQTKTTYTITEKIVAP